MSAAASKEVTTVQIAGVTFGFFTDEEVRSAASLIAGDGMHSKYYVHA